MPNTCSRLIQKVSLPPLHSKLSTHIALECAHISRVVRESPVIVKYKTRDIEIEKITKGITMNDLTLGSIPIIAKIQPMTDRIAGAIRSQSCPLEMSNPKESLRYGIVIPWPIRIINNVR